jgi:hypothetical protein
MEMKRVSAGELRAIGYDEANRVMRVEVGYRVIEFSGVSFEVWRRFSTASSMWSYYRDNIEENYPERIIR